MPPGIGATLVLLLGCVIAMGSTRAWAQERKVDETPAARVAALQKAFVDTYKSSAMLAAVKKRHMPFNPAPGAVIKKHVMATLSAPDGIVAKTRAVLGMK